MLKAGFSRIDITPPLGTPLAGYFYDRFAKGILDPLSVNAIAMNDGENTAIMVAVDALGITTPYADKIRDMIVERTGVDKDHVIVAALHQHTSVRIADPSIRSSLTDTAFLDVLYRKIADSALLAVNDMAEATVETANKETAEPISFVRRFLMKDGSWVAVRPSGTEPKCKFYFSVVAKDRSTAEEKLKAMREVFEK